MNELVKFLFTDWINYFLVLVTGFLIYMAIISGIRVILETSIPKCFEICSKHYYTMKNASEIAKLNLIKQEYAPKDFNDN